MRLRGFLFAGILGAMATVYFMRGGRFVKLLLGMPDMMKSVGNVMVGNGASKSGNTVERYGQGSAAHASGGPSSTHSNDLDTIKELINRNPQVKAQVHEIFQENKASTQPLQ